MCDPGGGDEADTGDSMELSDRFETAYRRASALLDLVCACRSDRIDPDSLSTVAGLIADEVRVMGEAGSRLIEQMQEAE
ncbi:MAG: hypothetical protein P1R74_11770 [Sedimenticola sp.]|nr:hypothetical protein [Sedimenticola sp.]